MIKIGTRPSKLAIAQTKLFVSELKASFPELDFEILQITTSGDNKQKLDKVERDKKDWIAELEEAVITGQVDFALHSAKDVPVSVSNESSLIPVLARAIPNDVFIGRFINGKRLKFSELSYGSLIGTASLRRRAQIILSRTDLKVQEFRGNVTSRISKLDQSDQLSGIVLAAAGLDRLGLNLDQFEILPTSQILPSSCQGILTVQIKSSRQDLSQIIEKLSPKETLACFLAERACVRLLQADCHSALACFSQSSGTNIEIKAKVFGQISLKMLEAHICGPVSEAEALGQNLAEILLRQGAQELLNES